MRDKKESERTTECSSDAVIQSLQKKQSKI